MNLPESFSLIHVKSGNFQAWQLLEKLCVKRKNISLKTCLSVGRNVYDITGLGGF